MRVIFFVALFTAGCREYDSLEVLEPKAEADLRCSEIDFELLSRSGCTSKSACHDEWRASGCHQTARYACKGSDRTEWTCSTTAYTAATSSLDVGGRSFVPDGVNGRRSGDSVAPSFYGVEMNASNGDSVRVIRNPDFTFEAVVTSNGEHSPALRDCVTAHFERDPLSGLRGSATLDCSNGSWTAKGSVVFVGCE